jgi:hypothetical protein
MENIKKHINTILLVLILLLQFCNNKSVKKQLNSSGIDLKRQMKIEGLETSKRMLYDQNAIVRTAIRPDDKMHQYDEEIKKLTEQDSF